MKSEREFGITQEYLRERFRYEDGGDEERGYGKFIRIAGKTNAKVGHWEWHINRCGYRVVKISKNGLSRPFSIHRLIWIYFFGDIPDGMEVDHINRNKLDNRIENLRLCSHRENMMNRRDNKSGFPGILWYKSSKKWVAVIDIDRKKKYIGIFSTLEEAVEARRQAEREFGIEVREEFHQAS